MISVWRWSKQKKIVESKGANDQIFAAGWHPSIKHLIVTCGKGHLSFWTFDSRNGTLMKNSAVFEGRDRPKTVIAICFSKTDDVVTGDSSGTLSLWDPTTFKIKKQAHAVHTGGIMALCISRKGTILSAGKDRTIAEWETNDLVRVRRPIELPDDAGIPRVVFNPRDSKIIVGTSRNTIFAGDFEADFEEIIDGDFEDVTCCAALQSHLFITASADGGIRQYNTSTKRREWRKNYGEGVTCVSANPEGSLLALGFCGGSWSIMQLSMKDTVIEQKESTQPITAIEFSPNGILLFVATKELFAVIYRFESSQRCHRIARIGSISSFIISLDWDVDSQVIRGNSSNGQIYHWSVSGEVVEHAKVRDLKWASCNCRVSFEAGCVAHSVEGITVVCRSTSQDKLAIGRDNGSVRIYSCPVLSTSAGFHALSGHTHSISAVAFTGPHLITAGLIDGTLYQWQL
ncbi:WD40 [Parelaphostrongylus tenuis]|uniref:WD40 n=1 Tax=Parelaphostrongylus tenuis TaxID=148309 RepID=A0AAD5MKL1_PARTN|nr:WD40 [Parelaphostrongylus tenuis]